MTAPIVPASPARPAGRPFLQSGDRMSQPEFHELNEASPELRHVELIEGVVYFMASPVRMAHHGEEQRLIITWLGGYAGLHRDLRFAGPSTILLDKGNEPEPDALLMRRPEHGGQAIVTAEGYVGGAPELVVEIAGSSSAIDLRDKLTAYQRAGVLEDIVWVTPSDRIRWYSRSGGRFVELQAGADGFVQSAVFPGLRLDLAAAQDRDVGRMLAALGS